MWPGAPCTRFTPTRPARSVASTSCIPRPARRWMMRSPPAFEGPAPTPQRTWSSSRRTVGCSSPRRRSRRSWPREGALLVIAGRPNAGKSSLFNALLGTERAIVTEVPGTTRDAVEAHAVLEGFPFRLVDTAGLRASDDRVERLGIEVSRKYLAAADLVLFCRDAGCEMRDTESREFLASCRGPIVEVMTKIDLTDRSTGRRRDRLNVSVVTGEGLADLKRRLAEVAYARLLALGDVEPVVTRARHRSALERALSEVEVFHTARGSGVDAAAGASHLRAAVGALDDLIGVVTPDDVLDRVFASFCVGK